MIDVQHCPECGVPQLIISEHLWLSSGVIVMKHDPSIRMSFIETGNLNPLFAGIEKLAGVSIEDILFENQRRGAHRYFDPLVPRELKDMLRRREIPLDTIIEALMMTNKINGLGRLEPVNWRFEQDDKDYITFRSYDSHCVPITCGDIAGGCEAVVEREHAIVNRMEVSPGVYEITAAVCGPSRDPKEEERSKAHLREGDIELERCPACGLPAALSGFKWDLDRGIITSSFTGRRMSIVHPLVLDPLFEKLKAELGDNIPRVVVESQRIFTKTGFHTMDDVIGEGNFRNQLALRGTGNLVDWGISPQGLRLRLDNACLPLLVVGMIQGLFELAFGIKSHVEWELSEESDLQMEVTQQA